MVYKKCDNCKKSIFSVTSGIRGMTICSVTDSEVDREYVCDKHIYEDVLKEFLNK